MSVFPTNKLYCCEHRFQSNMMEYHEQQHMLVSKTTTITEVRKLEVGQKLKQGSLELCFDIYLLLES